MQVNWQAISKNSAAAYVQYLERTQVYGNDEAKKVEAFLKEQDLALKVVMEDYGRYKFNIKGVLASGSKVNIEHKGFTERDEAYAQGVARAFMVINFRYAPPQDSNWLDSITPGAIARHKVKQYFKNKKR
jgi:hypothetical protein